MWDDRWTRRLLVGTVCLIALACTVALVWQVVELGQTPDATLAGFIGLMIGAVLRFPTGATGDGGPAAPVRIDQPAGDPVPVVDRGAVQRGHVLAVLAVLAIILLFAVIL